MQRNLFLTDLMTTGDHRIYDEFLCMSTLSNQKIETCNTFFALHLYELEKYDRKFAIIDRKLNSLITAQEYKNELERRIALLHAQGFKFIIATPWESKENIQNGNAYPKVDDLRCDAIEWTGGTTWFWSYMYIKHRNNNFRFNHESKSKDFLYLNKFPRDHRKSLYDKLQKGDLLENSLFTFHYLEPEHRLPPEYELPWVDRHNYPKRGFDQDVYERPYNDCAVSIVSETSVDCVFITEKIYKPLMAGQIFVVSGFKGLLAKLRSMGFQTYGEFMDESYDEEPDHDKRCDMIRSTLEKIKQLDYKELYANTEKVRTHNQKVFFDKDILGEEINRTLRLWFEFADRGQISS
jgi:hypothetical protein